MVISVLSPLDGRAGNTTSAITLAHALSLTQHKEVCLTHVDYSTSAITSALGLQTNADVTRSIGHVVKMLISGALGDDGIPDYAMQVFNGLDVYSTHPTTLEEQESLVFFQTLVEHMTAYNHVVIDVDTPVDSKSADKALEASDVVIVPITQEVHTFKKVKAFRVKLDSKVQEIQRSRRGKPVRVIYLVNHYVANIMSHNVIAQKLGVSTKDVMVLRDCPFFVKASNSSALSDVYVNALRGDSRVAGITYDMKRICKTILGNEFLWDNNFQLIGG